VAAGQQAEVVLLGAVTKGQTRKLGDLCGGDLVKE
jgi:hypothetical protein